DPGRETPLVYSLSSNPTGAFVIDSVTGQVSVPVANAGLLDPGPTTIQVQATESDGVNPVTQNVTVTVTEAALTITSPTTATYTEGAAASFYTAVATDPGNETPLVYSLSSNPTGAFVIDSVTGQVSVPVANAGLLDPGPTTIQVQATESDGVNPVTQNVTVTVTEAALTITSPTTATYTEGAVASFYTAVATDPGRETPLVYSLSSNPTGAFVIDSVTGQVSV